ncbi:MAG: cob(I)yrinic acid a,c-diamide adenosyltransferase [Candidatus Helarchaeota archaeon]|nr:cob(I)yrinic acid a,c-diamide adenosyltransferase [Candidatus Helarchaeota archaeon]
MSAERKRLKQGLVQVYFGSGKGKTTCALGQAFRALGHGFRVYMIQFMKGNVKYGEITSAKSMPNLTIRQFGRPDLIAEPEPIDIEEAQKGLAFAKEILMSDEYDIVILDEIGVAVDMKMIPVEKVLELIKSKPPLVELIITGRQVHPKILEAADLVTQMKQIKHYFVSQGISARFGIEF